MRIWARTVVLSMAGIFLAPVGQAETLADAMIAAYRNSSLLDQNEAVLRAADEDVATAVSALRPVLAFSSTAGWQRAEVDTLLGPTVSEGLAASVALSAELMLYDFGRSRLGIEIARESVMATRQALVQVEQQVLLAAVRAYVDVRFAQELVALRQSNFRLITQELRAAEARFEVGETTRTDVAFAEARLAGSRASLAAAEGQLLVARESYKAATGDYPGDLAALPALPDLPAGLEAGQEVARSTHPLIRQAQHLLALSELQVSLAEAAMKPTFGASASVKVDEDGKEAETIGLAFDQTLYAGGRLSSALRKAIAGKDGARAGLHQTAVGVTESLGVAWANLAVATASIAASEQQIVAAQTAFDGVKEQADAGAKTTLDVLDAEQELLDARNARLEAEAQRYVGTYQVLAAMGLLTVDHLQLGIATYDPEAYYKAVEKAPSHSAQGKALDRILDKIGN
ncbi:MAG TPA: TolC family outer membrane protein [Tabrizicola sp.]|nr:TolC family outer membrane protein [Tabrizicola sp.]